MAAPNATIEVRKHYTREQEEGIINAVHAALMEGIKTPERDRTIRLVVHEPHRFATPPKKDERYTLVDVDLFAGRSLDAKRALYRAIVNNLGKLGIPADHVKVLLRESAAENWGIRGGVPASEVDLGFKVDVQMRIAVLTFEGFNELDSFIAAAMLNRVKQPELKALIVCPSDRVASMNGVVVHSQAPLSFAREANADVPACTDSKTKPWVEEAGVEVLDQPFVAHGNAATAGGCLASHYLAAWVIARLAGWRAADSVLHYVAPVGEKREYVDRARAAIGQYL